VEQELKKLVGKKAWFMNGNLEIRKRSDSEIIDVQGGMVTLKHFLGGVNQIPLGAIRNVIRKDLLPD
jgi:hypothetical protein